MKKKLTAIALIVALLAVAVIGGTLAYFTDDDDSVENVFTVGNVEIELTEPKWTTGEEDAPEVYPGEALAKDPTVTNIGANPCFVRISVTGLDQFGEKGDITFETGYKEGVLGENWVDGGDGYFYYLIPLAADYQAENESAPYNSKVTTKLFEQVRMPVGLDGTEEAEPIVVSAQAVQAQGAKPSWSEVKSMKLADIQAWFTTCMPEPAQTLE